MSDSNKELRQYEERWLEEIARSKIKDRPKYSCKMCGKCCRVLTFFLGKDGQTKIDDDFAEARGLKIRRVNGLILLDIANECKYLSCNLCMMQGMKPITCRRFPEDGDMKNYVPEGCRYFEEPEKVEEEIKEE